jgi:Asp-tRNA(Asn)/Glu-tRNA(Gln) amidotransferase A subunit family amidase
MGATETIRETLRRIRSEDQRLHAFDFIALDPAGQVDGPTPERPLGGLPIGVKDILDTADMPTEYGSRIYAGHQPSMDAAIVTALKLAGAFIVGKTTTTEFATSPPTRTLNPRNTNHTPGGSSAGSAAAVAAGLLPVAIGTQTLGSVIRPASFCGVVGFKPTWGWFPTAGMKNLATSLDTIGLLTDTVASAGRVYRALVPRDVEPPVTNIRLAFSRQPNWDLASPDAKVAIERCIGKLRTCGFDITDVEMPAGFDAMTKAANVIHDYEMRRSLGPEFSIARDEIDPALAQRIERAGQWNAADYREALRMAEKQRAAFGTFMKGYDAVLCLAAGSEPPEGLSNTGDPMMSSAWTVLHAPCITLPALKGGKGLPIGLQIVGDRYQDLKLLRVAAVLEEKVVR